MLNRIFVQLTIALVLLLTSVSVSAQMVVNNDTLYGNEWIDYAKQYYRIKVGKDGIYRVEGTKLKQWLGAATKGSDLQMWNNGKEIPLFVTNNTTLNDGDYIEFYGQKNTIQMDSFMFENWRTEMLNPKYSNITDTSSYYLTLNTASTNARITEVNPDYQNNTLTPEPYFMFTEEQVFSDFHYKPTFLDNVRLSQFISSEGFGKGFSNNSSFEFATKNIDSDATEPSIIQYRFGSNSNSGEVSGYINGNKISTHFPLYNVIKINDNLIEKYIHALIDTSIYVPTNTLNAQNTLKLEATFGVYEFLPSIVSLTYPRLFDFAGDDQLSMHLRGGNKYIKLQNIAVTANYLYDIANNKKYSTSKTGTETKLLVSGNGSHNIWLGNPNKVEEANLTTFTDFNNLNPSYLIITNKKLLNTLTTENFIDKYAAYRSSPIGGGFTSATMYTDDIYQQFGYGLENNIYAFKNFSHWAKKQWEKLEYVLLLGKGRSYQLVRKKEQLESVANNTNFVPSYGEPPSDYLLFSEKDSPFPFFAVGRLAVKNMDEVENYLDKVKGHDAAINAPQTADKLWLKRLLHITGGTLEKPTEVNGIRNFLSEMAMIIENNKFGGKVQQYEKTDNTVTQAILLPKIRSNINDGVAIVNFFGHASISTLDFDLGTAKDYNNEGRLPFIFSLGCYSGNICTSSGGISEDFVLYPKVGAIGYVASTGSAYLDVEGFFGKDFYTSLGGINYGKSIGKAFRNQLNSYESVIEYRRRTLYQQFMLHCDPAMVMHGFDKPDYAINYNTIKTDPDPIQAVSEKFKISGKVINIGQAIDDSITLKIDYKLPNADTAFTIEKLIAAPKFEADFEQEILIPEQNVVGKNLVQIVADNSQKIDELSETNNKVISPNNDDGYPFFISENGVRPIYPQPFSIVNKTDAKKLIASSYNAIAPKLDYVLQIDTTELFNSPLLMEGKITQASSYVEWVPNITYVDSTVYYWRVSIDSQNVATKHWENSSFIYLANGSHGWNQSHNYQYYKDILNQLEIKGKSKFDFTFENVDVTVKSEVYNGAQDIPYTVVGGQKWGILTPLDGAATLINVVVWENGGFKLKDNPSQYGTEIIYINGEINRYMFSFDPSKESARIGIDKLVNDIADSATVLVYFYLRDYNASFQTDKWKQDSTTYGHNIVSALEKLGATEISKMYARGTVPYVLHSIKKVGKVAEYIGNTITDDVLLTGSIYVRIHTGTMNSTRIGPAKKWHQFLNKIENIEVQDSVNFDIYLIDTQGNKTTFLNDVTASEVDLSSIDANTYPYIDLRYKSYDLEKTTSPDLKYWRVLFDGKPEFLVNTNNNVIAFVADTLLRGETLKFNALAQNITPLDGDSLLVKYSIVDKNNAAIDKYTKLAKITNGAVLDLNFEYDTKSLAGNYKFVAEINPQMVQPEQYDFNNFAYTNFYVQSEDLNPVLDVTFDGLRIVDGDVVVPNPFIKIKLTDKNSFVLLNRNDILQLKLKGPNDNVPQLLDINSQAFTFKPASSVDRNEAFLEYRPTLADGDYQLIVERAQDIVGNSSGAVKYTVNFRVISKKVVSHLYNYPNPFSTSTKFVFTITGEVPNNMKIQIMTVTGKVVREITRQELGNIKLGHNITDFTWDGTDEYGSKLGNGVYFYRMVIGENEGDFEAYGEGNDEFFKKGFGKMVIIR